MTCRDFTDFLMDYFDGTMGGPTRRRFEEHLAECPDCVAYLATYRQTVALSRCAFNEDDEQPAPVIPESLVQAILKTRQCPGV